MREYLEASNCRERGSALYAANRGETDGAPRPSVPDGRGVRAQYPSRDGV